MKRILNFHLLGSRFSGHQKRDFSALGHVYVVISVFLPLLGGHVLVTCQGQMLTLEILRFVPFHSKH